MGKKKLTVPEIFRLKEQGKKIKMLVAYDYPFASLIEQSQVDMILVGDSLGMVVQGHDTTVTVTLEEIIYHLRTVRRAVKETFIVADMPFMTYVTEEDAVKNAGRLIREGADAVKLEGGLPVINKIAAIREAGIPVMGHIGLTPQSAGILGGFKVQGKNLEDARRLILEAQEIEKAGAFAIVLECVPSQIARIITERLKIVTLSTGAGPHTDGICLNAYDILGIFDRFVPRFVKQYALLAPAMVESFNNLCREVDEGLFPGPEHSFNISDEDVKELCKVLQCQ